jgi:hypothetical protein
VNFFTAKIKADSVELARISEHLVEIAHGHRGTPMIGHLRHSRLRWRIYQAIRSGRGRPAIGELPASRM